MSVLQRFQDWRMDREPAQAGLPRQAKWWHLPVLVAAVIAIVVAIYWAYARLRSGV